MSRKYCADGVPTHTRTLQPTELVAFFEGVIDRRRVQVAAIEGLGLTPGDSVDLYAPAPHERDLVSSIDVLADGTITDDEGELVGTLVNGRIIMED